MSLPTLLMLSTLLPLPFSLAAVVEFSEPPPVELEVPPPTDSSTLSNAAPPPTTWWHTISKSNYFWPITIMIGIVVFYCLFSILDKSCHDRREKKKERKQEARRASIALWDLEAQRSSAGSVAGYTRGMRLESLGDRGTGIKTPPPAYCR